MGTRKRIFSQVAVIVSLGFAARAQCTLPGMSSGEAFSVVSIKPINSNFNSPNATLQIDPGRITAPDITLRQLMAQAYGVRQDQILGGPPWLDTSAFSVQGTAAQPASRAGLMAMLRAALVARFNLACHVITRQQKLLALIVAPKGPKFRELAPDEPGTSASGAEMVLNQVSQLTQFLNNFSRMKVLDYPVIDETGLTGRYDIHFALGRAAPGRAGAAGIVGITREQAEEIPHLLDSELGLRLEPRTEPVVSLQIDRAEKPSEN